NPVADWIRSKPWDKHDRLEDVYATLVHWEDYPAALKKTLMHRWLLSATAAALQPIGFRTRGVLTLQGPQSIGKTAWTKSLVSDLALSHQVVKLDHHMDPHNKDSLLTAITHWIVEIGELDSSFKKDVAKFKGFLTQEQDKVRRPYAKVDSEYARRTVFCATVNHEVLTPAEN
ncbi:MAG: VapE domain-containing protein, partial [Caldimonas sp.]